MRKENLYRKMATVPLALACLTLILTAYAAVNVTTTITSSGTITSSMNIGLYENSACTVPLTNIDWGTLTPGTSVAKIVYIKNTQSTSALTLSMAPTNWNPTTANGPLSLAWNKQGVVLSQGQSTAATITLDVSSSTTSITSFSVQIAITGTA
jgi:hypothetical protein